MSKKKIMQTTAYSKDGAIRTTGDEDSKEFTISTNEVPRIALHVNPDAGIFNIKKSKDIVISIDRYNELTSDSDWELKDFYIKNLCQTTLWENKKTKEQKESMGTFPPSNRFNLGDQL